LTGASLAARDVSVVFGGVTALKDVTFEASGPGIVGLMGPNGSGKSTLLNVLSGLQRPTAGTVEIAGRAMTNRSARSYALEGVGRTFQTVRLVPELRVRENITVAMAGREARDAEVQARFDAAVSELMLTDVLTRWPDELPYGVQRRVEVARLALRGPRIMLLDEPSAGMRGDEAEEVGDLVRKLAAERLVVLVDHYIELMVRVCDRIAVLNNGEVIADGEPGETLRSDVVRRAYFG
jgi:ABC-type branched-subunit amino acid transport system ATPase component